MKKKQRKKYQFYRIEWQDIFGDAGHRDFEQLSNMKPATKITYAFLFKKDSKTIHTLTLKTKSFQIVMFFLEV